MHFLCKGVGIVLEISRLILGCWNGRCVVGVDALKLLVFEFPGLQGLPSWRH